MQVRTIQARKMQVRKMQVKDNVSKENLSKENANKENVSKLWWMRTARASGERILRFFVFTYLWINR